MPASSKDTVFSVSTLNQSVAQLLESNFSWIWVEGEISNLARPASGHIYFSLKDAGAQIKCAMFRGSNRKLTFHPDNGQQVLVRAKVSLYQPRGDYQLIVDRMEESGEGALRRQFELLKLKLAAENLFHEDFKLPIPDLPRSIGVITSASGAAIHDILSVIERRFPSIPVTLYPVPVQGVDAAPAICRALEQLPDASDCDVILLARGGGSLEDLWPFNEETVARAIFDCPCPIITGIGHEVDVTIADYVADFRAATPTAAAETVTPDQQTWLQNFDWYQQRLDQLMQEKILHQREKVQWLKQRLLQQHPANIIKRAREQCLSMETRLSHAWQHVFSGKTSQAVQAHTRLLGQNPDSRLQQKKQRLHFACKQLEQMMYQTLTRDKTRLSTCARTLHAVSPLQTLERGYSITLDINKKAVTSASQLSTGDLLETRLHKGRVYSRIEEIE